MSKDYKDTAKKLGIRYRVGKYGVEFGSSTPLPGMKKKWWKLVRITPLTGWIFDPHQITEAFANDPNFKISYKDKS